MVADFQEVAEPAVTRLRDECLAARTKGKRRLLDALYLRLVEGRSVEQMAEHFRLDRATASQLLQHARSRLVVLIAAISGITEPAELRSLLARSSGDLKSVLRKVGPLAASPEAS